MLDSYYILTHKDTVIPLNDIGHGYGCRATVLDIAQVTDSFVDHIICQLHVMLFHTFIFPDCSMSHGVIINVNTGTIILKLYNPYPDNISYWTT